MKDFLDELDMEMGNIQKQDPTPQKQNTQGEVTPQVKQTQTQSAENKIDRPQESVQTRQHQDRGSGGGQSGKGRHQNNKKQQASKGGALTTATGGTPSKYGYKVIQFPETKFFLPSLREGYTRYVPIGGNNEIGAKNMGMVQYDDDIILIDCGVQFAEPEMLGADYSIPDVSFLTKYTKNIKGFIITHAHLDHIGALKNILPVLDMPTLYGTKLTIGLMKKSIEEAGLMAYANFVEVDASKDTIYNIGKFQVEFFSVNHSIPDSAGVFIQSPGGAKFVHTGDFKIDHSPRLDAPANISRYEEIGNRGITLLLSDSTGSVVKGSSVSEAEVEKTLEEIIKNWQNGRLIIATFSSWISRVQQLIDIAEKYDKSIFLSGRSMVENISIAQKLGYITMKAGTIKKLTSKNTESLPYNKQIIITTGSQGEEFSALHRMAEGRHAAMTIQEGDTVIFSSSVVPGNERSVGTIFNKLLRYGVKIITKLDIPTVHTGGHAQQEEQKLFVKYFRPKYFMPIYGDLFFRTRHAETAMQAGVKESNVLLLDNGNIVDFAPNGSVFRSKIKVPIQDYVIDGHGLGLTTSHVIKAREQMMNAGVIVVQISVDKKTKAIIAPLRLETRGFVYIDEARFLHRIIIKKAREVYENTIQIVPDIEEKELLRIIRTDLEQFISKKIQREPMVIPIVTSV